MITKTETEFLILSGKPSTYIFLSKIHEQSNKFTGQVCPFYEHVKNDRLYNGLIEINPIYLQVNN